jgi:hypothetical protein
METKIKTIGLLADLVELDNRDHKIKDLAQLLLNAMNDWPTKDQTDISEFISEIKEYFGTPLTIDKIDAKGLKLSNDNAWQHEAGSSIAELIDLSTRFNNESDFDKILNNIIVHYEQELNTVDFVAELKYRTTEQGGRKTPAHSGYRPQVKFDFAEMQTSGQQIFLDKEIVSPGDTVNAKIRILSVDYFANKLTEGMQFEFREGDKVIGTGLIKQIINERLKKASR